MVKKLEELGIGRPSTYAATISTIQHRKYVLKQTTEPKQREIAAIIVKEGSLKKKSAQRILVQKKASFSLLQKEQ